jgi:hypothetical protein
MSKMKTYKVIAGCNEFGAMNWGDYAATVDQETHDRWAKALEPYIGKEVYLGGGGGRGYSKATLTGVSRNERGGLNMVTAHLKVHGVKKGDFREHFDPTIGSWQIIVEG